MKLRLLFPLIALVLPVSLFGQPTDTSRVVNEFEIEASIDDVWRAFTTTEGLKKWTAPLAEIDFKVGGKWRANYNADGELGDENTIENTILCYDPKRMISMKATKFPAGFEFTEAASKTWSVFYFQRLSDSKTKITIVGLGYDDSEQSKKLREFFKPANEFTMGQLKAALKKPSDQQQP